MVHGGRRLRRQAAVHGPQPAAGLVPAPPPNSWTGGSSISALAGIAALHLLSGFVTPPAENINLAFRVHEGWEKIFPDFRVYRIFLLASSAALFFAVESALRRIGKKQGGQSK
jgi:hypothetical protein